MTFALKVIGGAAAVVLFFFLVALGVDALNRSDDRRVARECHNALVMAHTTQDTLSYVKTTPWCARFL